MNKYEEALDIIARQISKLNVGIHFYSFKEVSEALTTLNELIEKSKECEWHYLNRDDNDLPEKKCDVIFTVREEMPDRHTYEVTYTGFWNPNKRNPSESHFDNDDFECCGSKGMYYPSEGDVIKWRYPAEEEKPRKID